LAVEVIGLDHVYVAVRHMGVAGRQGNDVPVDVRAALVGAERVQVHPLSQGS